MKVKMLLSQFNSFAMAQDMVVNNKDQRTLIKPKMKVSIEMKKHMRLNILKTTQRSRSFNKCAVEDKG